MKRIYVQGLGCLCYWSCWDCIPIAKVHNIIEKCNPSTFLFNNRIEQIQQNGEMEKYKKLITGDEEVMELRRQMRIAAESKLSHGIIAANDLVRDITNERDAAVTLSLHRIEYLKAKYDGLLITNKHDSTDLTLYVPDEDNVESYIANNAGVYVVGNTVVKANLKNDVSESIIRMSKAFMPNNNIPTNSSVFKPNKHKKVYLDAYMINIRLWVRMHCKKKMWYGWKNDPNRSYYLVTKLNNITYFAQGKYGQEVPTNPLPMFIFDNHKKVKNGFNIILGKVNGGRITGTLYAWTDMTIDRDSKGNIIMVTEGGITHPKGSVEKAQIVNVNLAPTNP